MAFHFAVLALGSLLPAFPVAANVRAGTAAPSLLAESLRVDDLTDPIGLDSAQPHFSWKLKANDPRARNLAQTAYRIQVASSPDLLRPGHAGDEMAGRDMVGLWDSGRVEASGFLGIRYDGQPFRPLTRYFWRVRVWDQSGAASPWSAIASFRTALLAPAQWSAKWIAAQPDRLSPPVRFTDDVQFGDTAKPLPIFRREFVLEKPVRQAILIVTGLGQYEFTLNGRAVTASVLNPGWTDYGKTILYQTYEVTSLLKRGANCAAAMLGNGMYNAPGLKGRYAKFSGSYGQPKLIAQLEILYGDGSSATIATGSQWKTIPGPIRYSSTYGGEDFDAREEPAGWRRAGFDDSAWPAAVEVSAPADPATRLPGRLSGKLGPEIKVIETLKPVWSKTIRPGVTVYDFGRNFSGWPQIAVKGSAGASVVITPAELLDAQGEATQASAAAGPGNAVLFTYILKGGARAETWHPRFTYYGFRYLQIEAKAGSSELPEILSVSGQAVHAAVTRTGEFSSALPLLNRIHTLIDGAILANLASVLTDCPTREKLGWLEQTHLMGESIMENFDVSRLYEKLGDDMADSQLPDGLVPAIAPEFVAFLNADGSNTPFRDSPEWGSAVILAPWSAYRFYGDPEPLSSHYASMASYAAYLGRKAQDHILSYGLGDWYDVGPKEPGESQFTGKGVTATAIYYQDLVAMAQIAALLGRDSDAAGYAKEAGEVKTAFNRRFFHPESSKYDTGSQTANAMPLALDLVPEERRAAVLENLIADIRAHENHVTAGDIGFHYLVRALTGSGRSDVLLEMLLRKDAPSYGYQLARGATTLTEAWDANPDSSQDHFMLGHAEEWFYRGLAGIDLDLSQPAPRQIVLRPALLKRALGASATVDSALGIIRSSWTYEGNWSLYVEIPPGAQATVYLPAPASAIAMDSKPLDRAVLPKKPAESDGVTAIVLGSGRYRFRFASLH